MEQPQDIPRLMGFTTSAIVKAPRTRISKQEQKALENAEIRSNMALIMGVLSSGYYEGGELSKTFTPLIQDPLNRTILEEQIMALTKQLK